MVLKLIRVVEKLQAVNSPTDVLAVLKIIRKMLVCENLTYEQMLERCLHTEDITSRFCDPAYPIFKNDLASVLEGRSEDEQIIFLTEMIMMF